MVTLFLVHRIRFWQQSEQSRNFIQFPLLFDIQRLKNLAHFLATEQGSQQGILVGIFQVTTHGQTTRQAG